MCSVYCIMCAVPVCSLISAGMLRITSTSCPAICVCLSLTAAILSVCVRTLGFTRVWLVPRCRWRRGGSVAGRTTVCLNPTAFPVESWENQHEHVSFSRSLSVCVCVWLHPNATLAYSVVCTMCTCAQVVLYT